MSLYTESPCIGICSTVYGDQFCRGCKRHYLEVIEWNRYEVGQKRAINQRLEQQVEKIIVAFLVIEDAKKLKTCLDQVALRPVIYQSACCWAYELLRLRAKQMDDLNGYGLRAKPLYQALTVNELFTQIDDKLYTSICNFSL